jgi:hypothetical protein
MPWIIASHRLSSAARDEEELVGQEMPAMIAAVDETARWPPAPMPVPVLRRRQVVVPQQPASLPPHLVIHVFDSAAHAELHGACVL